MGSGGVVHVAIPLKIYRNYSEEGHGINVNFAADSRHNAYSIVHRY